MWEHKDFIAFGILKVRGREDELASGSKLEDSSCNHFAPYRYSLGEQQLDFTPDLRNFGIKIIFTLYLWG